jgi:hypothetical protein
MGRIALPLDRIRIASPCSTSWEEMKGDDRVRICDYCQLRVFNLSGMSQHEAEELIAKAEGRLCVRFYQRVDGTVITADCPIGLRALRRTVWRAIGYGAGAATLLFAYLAGVISSMTEMPAATNSDGQRQAGLHPFFTFQMDKNPVMGLIAPPTASPTGKANRVERD